MMDLWLKFREIKVFVELHVDEAMIVDDFLYLTNGGLNGECLLDCEKAQQCAGPSGNKPTAGGLLNDVGLGLGDGIYNDVGLGDGIYKDVGLGFQEGRADCIYNDVGDLSYTGEEAVNIEGGVAVDVEEVAEVNSEEEDANMEDDSEEEDVDWDENLKAYLVRTKAFTEEDHDPEGCLAREKIYESVKRGSRHKAIVPREEEGEDDVDSDPLEEIFRNIRDREVTAPDDEVVEVQRGYDSDNYLSNEARSLVNSDGDSDHDDATSRRSRYPRFNFNAAIPEFAKTMVFIDHEQFRSAIKKYSIASKKELRFVKNEPRRLRVKCKVTDSCPWRIYAAWNEEIRVVQVRKFNDEHTCHVDSWEKKMLVVMS
ncbi:Transposase, MuDR, plant [Corchorus olitorius]|uniref:Transposase, MuDR, plant n=1 Tax=Corchorus olitorius TaxID=93759 RepID=A0A1R3K828_9ROSI|nr:Transposase, MuDR, plant [Corchorus olitorius]